MSRRFSLWCRSMTCEGSSLVSSSSIEFKEFASNSDPVNLAFDLKKPQEDIGGKAPVIFLHGITASKECWNDIPATVAIKTKRKVYAVDLRNHGDSPWSETFEFDSNGLDLRHFMDIHKIDKAIVVGHSMGGMIAMKFALEMPQKIEKLVIEDATIQRIPHEVVAFLRVKLSIARDCVVKIPAYMDDADAHKLLAKLMMQKAPPELKEYARFDENIFILKKVNGKFTFKANIDAIDNVLSSLPGTLPEPEGRYYGPTCFIYGKKSPFNVGSDEDVIRNYFPYAELFGVENACHTVHNDCHSEFMNILLKFLREDYFARL